MSYESLKTSAESVVVHYALFVGLLAASLTTSTASAQGPGFPNVRLTAGELLSGPNASKQGRTAVVAYHQGVLFTVPESHASAAEADHLVRTWDISNPRAPLVIARHGLTPHGFSAHGFMKAGEHLILDIGPNAYRSVGPGLFERESFPGELVGGHKSSVTPPWEATMFWSYKSLDHPAVLSKWDEVFATWDHLGLTGVIGHPFILGNLLIYASDQSDTGVATYDISDPRNPVLLDVMNDGGAVGGYFPDLWGSYIVFPRRRDPVGFVVVDFTDPTDLRVVAQRELDDDADPMYVQCQDEFVFTERYKIDMRTFDVVLTLDEEEAPVDTSQFSLPLGNMVVTGGLGDNRTGMAIWAHQDEPDTRGPYVAYHIPRAGQTRYPLEHSINVLIHETLRSETIVNGETFIVRPLGGAPIEGLLYFAYNDVLTFAPSEDLRADTTYEVVIPAGGIRDAADNGIEGYSFRFSTGGGVTGESAPIVTSFTATRAVREPGAPVTYQVRAETSSGSPLEYRFDFGDGTSRTEYSTDSTAVHTYAAAGHYQCKVQVRAGSSGPSSALTGVTIMETRAGPPPASSSPLAVDAAGSVVWAVNADNNTVTAIDAETQAVRLERPVGADPRSVAVTHAGEVWIACQDGDILTLLDDSGGILDTVSLGYGARPAGVVLSPDGRTAYVTLSGTGQLVRIDVTSRREMGRLDLGPTPEALAISGDGQRILVARFISSESFGEIWDVDTVSWSVRGAIHLIKDRGPDTLSTGRGVPNYLRSIAISPDGREAWVVCKKDNTDRGAIADGREPLDEDNTVRTMVCVLNLEGDVPEEQIFRRIDFDNSDAASAITFSPLGDYAFVTLQGNNQLLVIDYLAAPASASNGAVVTRLETDLAPYGVAVDNERSNVYVRGLTTRRVTVFEAAEFLRAGKLAFPKRSVLTTQRERLSPEVLRGKQVFYNASDPRMSGEGYMSCASCHLDGGHDGRVWDFADDGEGLRNTTTLRGRSGLGHGAVHWSANFDEIQDFEGPIRKRFGGTGFLEDAEFRDTADPLGEPKAGRNEDLDALAAYVSSLSAEFLPRSPYRTAGGTLTADAQAGASIFGREGCADCHVPELGFVDGLRHNVGTTTSFSGERLGEPLVGVETPTLLGVHATGPYLHHGEAASLGEVFDYAGGTTLQAEEAFLVGVSPRDGIRISFYRGGEYVALTDPGHSIKWFNVHGGAGGPARLRVRYSSMMDHTVQVVVNGQVHELAVPETMNTEGFPRNDVFGRADIDITLRPGLNNTVELTTDERLRTAGVAIDEVVVTNADDFSRAEPHRRVGRLSAVDQRRLLRYVLELDGSSDVACGSGAGDTRCEEIRLEALEGSAGAPGAYRVSVEATDDSGDPIFYTFTAKSSSGDEHAVGPTRESSVEFVLGEGEWVVHVRSTDDAECPDLMPVASCEAMLEVFQDERFIRGDCDGDGSVCSGVSDALTLFNWLFLGGREPSCLDACDVTASFGDLDLSDGITNLTYCFLGGLLPPPPFPECGRVPLGDPNRAGCASGAWTCQ